MFAIPLQVTFSVDELCNLLHPSAAMLTVKGSTASYGNGLAAAFAFCDVPQIISGDSLYVWDPCGRYMTHSMAEKQVRGQLLQHPRGCYIIKTI